MIDGTAARLEMLTSTIRLIGGPTRAHRRAPRAATAAIATRNPGALRALRSRRRRSRALAADSSCSRLMAANFSR